jgi:lipoate-protein ligase A
MGTKAEMIPISDDAGPPPAFCFARTGRYEIESDGRKLVGSAQRRQGGCFLQHGSVLLGVDEPRLRALFPTTRDPLSTMTTLEEALDRRPSFDECAETLQVAFEAEHDLTLRPGGLTPEETAFVDLLVAERYGTDAWLYAEGGTPLVPPRSRAAG